MVWPSQKSLAFQSVVPLAWNRLRHGLSLIDVVMMSQDIHAIWLLWT